MACDHCLAMAAVQLFGILTLIKPTNQIFVTGFDTTLLISQSTHMGIFGL